MGVVLKFKPRKKVEDSVKVQLIRRIDWEDGKDLVEKVDSWMKDDYSLYTSYWLLGSLSLAFIVPLISNTFWWWKVTIPVAIVVNVTVSRVNKILYRRASKVLWEEFNKIPEPPSTWKRYFP